jgi:hypothetical protein
MDDPISTATWAALLAQWTHFAQSALALPASGESGRWRRAVPDIIALQALTFALAQIDSLPAQEQRLGLDRAALGIKSHERSLTSLWSGHALPEPLSELLTDAHNALALAQTRTPAPPSRLP